MRLASPGWGGRLPLSGPALPEGYPSSKMPRVPEHAVVSRLSDRSGLAVKRQSAEYLSDSVIVIKMRSAGVCGTDLAILAGTRPGQAEVLGHEGVGIVLYAPEDCGVSKGARVIVNPVHRKHPRTVIGHSRDGVFRELFCLDAADAVEGSHLVLCPTGCSLEDTELVLAEPLASVLYSLELLREKCGAASLLIRGSGTVGILAAKLWPILTGSFAILVSKSEAHARWLRESTRWPANVRICCGTTLASAIGDCSGSSGFNAAILCCSRESAPEGLCWLLDVVQDGRSMMRRRAALEDLDDVHAPAATRARVDRLVGWGSAIGGLLLLCRLHRCHRSNQLTRPHDGLGLGAAGQQTAVPYPVESAWQDVDQEPPDELVRLERHGLVAAGPLDPVVFVAERYAGRVGGDKAAVGDRDPVGVAGQIG